MAETKKYIVLGAYRTRNEAERATDLLMRSGVPASDISILLPKGLGANATVIEPGGEIPKDAARGATIGAGLGGVFGLLAGIAVMAIPAGGLIAAGPLVAMLGGVGIGGLTGGATGAVIGALVGLGMPEEQARTYESHLQKNRILLSVHCDTPEEVRRAKDFLDGTGAEDISSTELAAKESTKQAREKSAGAK